MKKFFHLSKNKKKRHSTSQPPASTNSSILAAKPKTKQKEKEPSEEQQQARRRHSMPTLSSGGSSDFDPDFCIDPTAAFIEHVNGSNRSATLFNDHYSSSGNNSSKRLALRESSSNNNDDTQFSRRGEEEKEEERAPASMDTFGDVAGMYESSDDGEASFGADQLMDDNEVVIAAVASAVAAHNGSSMQSSSRKSTGSLPPSTRGQRMGNTTSSTVGMGMSGSHSSSSKHPNNNRSSSNHSSGLSNNSSGHVTVDYARRRYVDDEDNDESHNENAAIDKDEKVIPQNNDTQRRSHSEEKKSSRRRASLAARIMGASAGSNASIKPTVASTTKSYNAQSRKQRIRRASMDSSAFQKADNVMHSLSEIEQFVRILQQQDTKTRNKMVSESLLRNAVGGTRKLTKQQHQLPSSSSLLQNNQRHNQVSSSSRRRRSTTDIVIPQGLSQSMNDTSNITNISSSANNCRDRRVSNPDLEAKINKSLGILGSSNNRNSSGDGGMTQKGMSLSMNDLSNDKNRVLEEKINNRRRRHSINEIDVGNIGGGAGGDQININHNPKQRRVSHDSIEQLGNSSSNDKHKFKKAMLPTLLEAHSAHHRHPMGQSRDKKKKENDTPNHDHHHDHQRKSKSDSKSYLKMHSSSAPNQPIMIPILEEQQSTSSKPRKSRKSWRKRLSLPGISSKSHKKKEKTTDDSNGRSHRRRKASSSSPQRRRRSSIQPPNDSFGSGLPSGRGMEQSHNDHRIKTTGRRRKSTSGLAMQNDARMEQSHNDHRIKNSGRRSKSSSGRRAKQNSAFGAGLPSGSGMDKSHNGHRTKDSGRRSKSSSGRTKKQPSQRLTSDIHIHNHLHFGDVEVDDEMQTIDSSSVRTGRGRETSNRRRLTSFLGL